MRFRLVSAKIGFIKAGQETVASGWGCVGLALGEVGAEWEGMIGCWPWLSVCPWVCQESRRLTGEVLLSPMCALMSAFDFTLKTF